MDFTFKIFYNKFNLEEILRRRNAMQTLIEFFGFTDFTNALWNTVGYLALIIIIIGVFSERYRNILITVGAGVLAYYAGIFLHNPMFATLQALIVFSGLLSITGTPKRPAMFIMIALTAAAYLFLITDGAIVDAWTFMGSLGLLGIAFGLIILPKHYGFILMAVGGTLLVIYAFAVAAWVFFFLNIFFIIANIYTLQKQH